MIDDGVMVEAIIYYLRLVRDGDHSSILNTRMYAATILLSRAV